ncbi:MAG: hypothetical protein WC517_02565 [Patescibacteria group bacterium]
MVSALLGLAYFLVGCALATPYNFLAGGDVESFVNTTILAPIGVIFLFIVHSTRRLGYYDKRPLKRVDWFFWLLVFWLVSPVILNGVSILLGHAGYAVAAHCVFKDRYSALLVIPLVCLLVNVVSIWMNDLWKHYVRWNQGRCRFWLDHYLAELERRETAFKVWLAERSESMFGEGNMSVTREDGLEYGRHQAGIERCKLIMADYRKRLLHCRLDSYRGQLAEIRRVRAVVLKRITSNPGDSWLVSRVHINDEQEQQLMEQITKLERTIKKCQIQQ